MNKQNLMTPSEAEIFFSSFNASNSKSSLDFDDDFSELRNVILKAYFGSLLKYGNSTKKKYPVDLNVGLALYEYLINVDQEKINFSNREASDEKFWIYLHARVIPDIIADRWDIEEQHSHIYSRKNRIWLMNLWWYVHITWQGNREDTYLFLERFSSDTILQLVERNGGGYDLELYQEIMNTLSRKSQNDDSIQMLFRRVMTLNTSFTRTITPALYNGGIPAYVEMLFQISEGKK